MSQLAVPLLGAAAAFPLVHELCMHARALHADFVAALVRRLEVGGGEVLVRVGVRVRVRVRDRDRDRVRVRVRIRGEVGGEALPLG